MHFLGVTVCAALVVGNTAANPDFGIPTLLKCLDTSKMRELAGCVSGTKFLMDSPVKSFVSRKPSE